MGRDTKCLGGTHWALQWNRLQTSLWCICTNCWQSLPCSIIHGGWRNYSCTAMWVVGIHIHLPDVHHHGKLQSRRDLIPGQDIWFKSPLCTSRYIWLYLANPFFWLRFLPHQRGNSLHFSCQCPLSMSNLFESFLLMLVTQMALYLTTPFFFWSINWEDGSV